MTPVRDLRNCFECDNCYGVCPDNAITRLGPGLCAAECPCGAIRMGPEPT